MTSAWTSAAALECEGVVLDDGCLFTITGSDTPEPDDGYAVTNAHGAPFYDFVRAHNAQTIGYPISQRWVDGPHTLQAFQKVILQWDPNSGRMNYHNTLDVLANRYPDVQLPNVPPHQVIETDGDGDFASVARAHLALLEENPSIKARFLGEPDWLSLYGLPIRYEEREVDGDPQGLQLLRTQRTVFEIWNVAAPGITVGGVNLQNVPDKLKQLDNVIIPNTAKAPWRASDPRYPALIANLYWVADGLTTPLEQAAVPELERIYAGSPEFLRYLVQKPDDWFVRNTPAGEADVRDFARLADLVEQPWFQDGLSPTEERLFGPWGARAAGVLDLANLVLQTNWVTDGLDDGESELIHDLVEVGHDERQALDQTNPGTGEPTIAYYVLQMPFLYSVESFDRLAIRSLYRLGWTNRHEQHTIVARFAEQGGITDNHARIIPVLGFVVESKPALLGPMLDPSIVLYEERTIALPHTGQVTLAVIRTRPGDGDTMTYLEEAVRYYEGFIRRPLPTNYIALHVSEAVEPWGGLFLGTHIAIREGYDNRNHDWNPSLRGVIHHEVSHYYWHKGPSWLGEGGANFFGIHSGATGTGEGLRELTRECRNTSVHDATSQRRHECRIHFGVELFYNLYHNLGEAEFLRGLWRLYDSTHGDLSTNSCEGMQVGPCHLRFAFVTDAPRESAALVERFLGEVALWED